MKINNKKKELKIILYFACLHFRLLSLKNIDDSMHLELKITTFLVHVYMCFYAQPLFPKWKHSGLTIGSPSFKYAYSKQTDRFHCSKPYAEPTC